MAFSYSSVRNKSLENKVYSINASFWDIGSTYINRVFPFCSTEKSMKVESDELWRLVSPRLQEQVEAGTLTIEQIAAFCKASPLTVKRWLSNKNPANGERLIRLWELLAFTGSNSPEMDKIPPLNRLLSQLYAFDVIALDEVQMYASYKTNHSGMIFNMFRGVPLMHPEVSIEELITSYEEVLNDRKLAWNPTWDIPVKAPAVPAISVEDHPRLPESPEPLAAPEVAVPSLESLLVSDPKLALATLLGAAAPLATYLRSDAANAEERSAFRKLINTEVLFDLSNTLSALCSERAREMTR